MYLRKTEFEGVDWLILIQDRVETSLNMQLIFGCHKDNGSKSVDQMSNSR
jgi:hypothetical protein